MPLHSPQSPFRRFDEAVRIPEPLETTTPCSRTPWAIHSAIRDHVRLLGSKLISEMLDATFTAAERKEMDELLNRLDANGNDIDSSEDAIEREYEQLAAQYRQFDERLARTAALPHFEEKFNSVVHIARRFVDTSSVLIVQHNDRVKREERELAKHLNACDGALAVAAAAVAGVLATSQPPGSPAGANGAAAAAAAAAAVGSDRVEPAPSADAR